MGGRCGLTKQEEIQLDVAMATLKRLRARLNFQMSVICRRDEGKLFQAVCPATEKALFQIPSSSAEQ